MFIDPKHQQIAFAVRRSGMFLEEYLSTRFPFLRTAPEGVWSSIYRHATPTGCKPEPTRIRFC